MKACLIVDDCALARGVAAAQQSFYLSLSPYVTRLEVVCVGTGSDTFKRDAGDVARPSTDPAKVSLVTVSPADDDSSFALLSQVLNKRSAGATTTMHTIRRLAMANTHLRDLASHPRMATLFVARR